MTDLELVNRLIDLEEKQAALWGYIKMVEKTEMAILVTMLGFVVTLGMVAIIK